MVKARQSVILLFLAFSAPCIADVTYVVTGVDEVLRDNILRYVDTVQIGPSIRLDRRDLEEVRADAERDARLALRPYGYYNPQVTTRVSIPDGELPVVEIRVTPGPPLRIASVVVDIVGPGADKTELRYWLDHWPLVKGDILNQETWEQQKQEVLDVADSQGYLAASIATHALEIDILQHTASIQLIVDTGPRFVMGDVEFGEHILKPFILESVPRFKKGDYYTARLVHKLRTDLWKTGYFTDVTVVEIERPELSPPTVDLQVSLESETRNTYHGALGWGSGTGPRIQASWQRRPISSNGDRLDLAIGWQHLDEQFRLRGTYFFPLRRRSREFWTADLTLNFENLDFEVKRNPEDEDYVQLASGDVNEQQLRLGWLKINNFRSGEHQLFDTLFVQHIDTQRRFTFGNQPASEFPLGDPEFEHLLNSTDSALSIGWEMDLFAVEGKSFRTRGHRDRAWIFHSNDAFGSDVEFTQAYLSTRRSYVLGDRFKFHVRGEVGYTDADVNEFTIDTSEDPLLISVTRLPNFYRFKAGGSMSVRGYGFEQLSDNDIGSNNIITASAEVEYRFLDSWSAALFADIGNAFNDWNEPDLKRGAGIGIRWYSFAGEVRIDYARALDFEGDPWRLHITIGTPLL